MADARKTADSKPEAPPPPLARNFVHLRVHTAYSLSEGAIKPDKLAALARQHGMPAVGVTDTANLFGALEFSQAAAGKGVQPIIGCQIPLARPRPADARPGEIHRLPPDPVAVIAQDQAGLANLRRLSSRCYLDTEPGLRPQVAIEALEENAAGLILLTGGTLGPIARLIAEGQDKAAEALLLRLARAYDGRLYIELHRHGLAVEDRVEPALIDLAYRHGLPLVAANDCYFATPEMHEAHDALLCIAEGVTVSERNRRHVTAQHWFKPPAAMRALFADLPEACDNTLAIARRCAVMVESAKPMLPVSPKVMQGATEAETVKAMAEAGLEQRLAESVWREGMDEAARAEAARPYRERLAYELGVIETMGFSGYFLIVADFIQWAKSQGIPVGPGRGSGAGSVAAWSLSITDLDPLRFGLLFERFLNPERVSMPDFDIDFCQDRRDEVIRYVQAEYGAERVAQIITFGKLQARAVVRDVGRVLEVPLGLVNKIAKMIPNNPAKPVTLAQAIEGEAQLRELQATDEQVRRTLEIALQLEGLYRHASTHAAGVVIGDRPLVELIPLYRDPRSALLVTQYSMKHVEQAGLVKFDFLGLKTLTVLARAEAFVREQGELELDLARLPLDDAKTYTMLQHGDAAGVFQFESQGMRDVLRQMRPDRFEDLIAAVALYRPGPMANIPAYCARKHGEPWEAPHPDIHDILAETYGIMVYQEQVMQIAQKLAGYSLGGADMLRRAMGKKIRAEMEAQRKIFQDGATKQGIPAAKAGEIFDLMEKFADYGFNKSHAAAYALVAYQTAYLKANHPVAFLAASMSLDMAVTDKLAALKQEADRMGVPVLPPDINRSRADFAIERLEDGRLGIRYALAAVKKVGKAAMEAVVAAREAGGAFRSLADFARRVDPRQLNKQQVENLVRAGAFDSLEGNRARLLQGAELLLKHAQAAASERDSSQENLFGAAADPGAGDLRLPDMPDWPPMERLGYEAEAVGFHLTAHPLDAYRATLKRLGVVPSSQIEARALSGGARVKLAGTIVGIKERTTKTGSRMAWVKLSDTVGAYEVTLFSEVLSRARPLLEAGNSVVVAADLRSDADMLRITASEVEPLDRVAAAAGAWVRVWLGGAEAVARIKELIQREGAGKGRVYLVPRLSPAEEAEIALPGGWKVTPRLNQVLRLLPGVTAVEEV
ncbi:MAG: DNA polymerase III subunit alpha [Alphaproteobacteria bacterium]|nr:DNA polymerase III subunit alpha [Alphaproteobacteria bacterium]